MFIFAVLVQSPSEIFHGLYKILIHRAGLIADNFFIGGIGATFFNAGLIMLISLLLFHVTKVAITGPGIACILLCSGFSMFGKDILNIWPIILGVHLYARRQKSPFSKYIYTALYGTSLSPIVTEIALIGDGNFYTIVGAILTGVLIGFILPPLSTYCLRVHQGYSLYNVGFSAGLVGTLLVSLLRSFGYNPSSQLAWEYNNSPAVMIYLFALFFILFFLGFYLSDWSFKPWFHLFRHSGRLMSDFVLMDGLPAVLMNMGSLGVLASGYILMAGGTLNGATIGGIFTIVGFAAFGKHLRNVVPVMTGVILGSFYKIWNLHDPAVQLSALFSTSLAPLSGQFGWKYGIIAGFLHSSMVLSVGILHGGLNLYNNGFSAGIIALIMIPLIETIEGEKQHHASY